MDPISDKELLKIPVKDNGEKLVDANEVCPKIKVEIGQYMTKEGLEKDASKMREKVAEKLNKAQSSLPKGYTIVLRCAHRPIRVQTMMWEKRCNKIKKEHPEWTEEQIRTEGCKFIAPPDIIPPHSTGGALDIFLIDSEGKVVDMGTEIGEFGDKTYTDSKDISKTARKNRDMLIEIMEKAGFINYPTEWWHWSYGDRYWAAVKKKESIYDSV